MKGINGRHYHIKIFSETHIYCNIQICTKLIWNIIPRDDVPNQFSADLDVAIYVGFRKDFYMIVSPVYPLHEEKSSIRQIGFDLGLFAGIGSSPVNPTVTNNLVSQEY